MSHPSRWIKAKINSRNLCSASIEVIVTGECISSGNCRLAIWKTWISLNYFHSDFSRCPRAMAAVSQQLTDCVCAAQKYLRHVEVGAKHFENKLIHFMKCLYAMCCCRRAAVKILSRIYQPTDQFSTIKIYFISFRSFRYCLRRWWLQMNFFECNQAHLRDDFCWKKREAIN